MHALLWPLLLLPAFALAGALYQSVGALLDRQRFRRRGTMVDLGSNRSLYISERGNGSPTIVFESGLAATSLNWTALQNALSPFARTIAYDRLSLGWSSAADTARTPANIVRELHALLQHIGAQPPYILVGHSFGGLLVQHFAAEHPSEVAGLVLIDPLQIPMTKAQRDSIAQGLRLAAIGRPLAHIGVARLVFHLLLRPATSSPNPTTKPGFRLLLNRLATELRKMPPEVWPIVAAHWSRPAFYRGLAAHLHALPAITSPPPIDNIPTLLLTQPGTPPPIALNTRQITAPAPGHWIHLDHPDLVLDAIRDLIAQCGFRSEGM
jgi:pimeloyl-ACP methyl ester carboxylesterase